MIRALVPAVGLVLVLPAAGVAQARSCDFTSVPGGSTVQVGDSILLHDPFEVQCTDGAVLRARSGAANRATGEIKLNGDVFFQDSVRTLTAQQALYSRVAGRLYATGDVVFTDRVEGTTLRGPELEYYRAMETRPVPEVNAGQRPHLTLQPRSDEPDAQPLEVDGDRMTMIGQNDLSVFGDVVIHRPDLNATSSEARFNDSTEVLELRGSARIRSDEYILAGEVVRALMPDGQLEHVDARSHAMIRGEDLTVTAPELELFFLDGDLQRTVARGVSTEDGRPLARARAFRLEADSLDAKLPGQKLERVVAVGNARGESIDTTVASTDSAATDSARMAAIPVDSVVLPVDSAVMGTPADSAASVAASADSVPPDSMAATLPGDSIADREAARSLIENDWIVGDTITGFFTTVADTVQGAIDADSTAGASPDSTAAGDSTVVLDRIVASGSAQSLYRVEQPDDSTSEGRKGVNFLAGRIIELDFEHGELSTARVTGLNRGLYLDPGTDSTASALPAADTTTNGAAPEPQDAEAAEPEGGAADSTGTTRAVPMPADSVRVPATGGNR